MAFGLSAGAIGLIGAGTSLVGGMMGADAASDAAAGQAQATRESNALQEKMFNKNIELQQPSIDAGNLSRNRLLQLLGLGTGTTPGTSGAPANMLTREQIAKELQDSGKYGTEGSMQYVYSGGGGEGGDGNFQFVPGGIDQGRLDTDIAARLAQQDQQQAQMQAQQQTAQSDPEWGSLMRDFGLSDYQEDPGYQFRLSEGEKGINRSLASRGNFLSGAGLKALNRFNSDQASQEYGNAYNRFENNKTGKFNKLTSLTGGGQTAATTIGNMGTNYATSVGNNLTSNANAQGAAGIAGANSWGNALTSGVNNWQQQNFNNSLLKNLGRGTGYGGGGAWDVGSTFDWGRE